jgi:pSer/pThr/pTyr-binding forkhead associated (FHA) protein
MDISLILLKKDGTKKVFPVRNKATILGRRPECDLCIPLQVVSRRHCQLSQEDSTLKVRDLSSSNGTFLNGQKVSDEIQVKPGDNLQVGPLTFTIQIDGMPAQISAPDSAMIQPTPDISKASTEDMNQSGTFVG